MDVIAVVGIGVRQFARLLMVVDTLRNVQIDNPSGNTDAVGPHWVMVQVVLVHHYVADDSAALALARHHPDPLQHVGFGDVFVRREVFDVVPYA